MALILVAHDTASPALYGALAAVVAAETGAMLAHRAARFDTSAAPDAVQHVAARGALVPSGLLWYERLTGREVGPVSTADAIAAAAKRDDVVVPLHPTTLPAGEDPDALARAAGAAGVAVRRYRVEERAACFALRPADGAAPALLRDLWTRDRYGRPVPAPAAATSAGIAAGRAVGIALIGRAHDHRDVYPGAWAALGDAADEAGLPLDVTFVDPTTLRPSEVAGLLTTCDGVLLPGGADMSNVAGQILVAHAALASGTPVLGLCLGMQTMATALLQTYMGEAGVNLAEADPTAARPSFVAMAGEPGLAAHRLGEGPTHPATDAGQVSAGLPVWERFNHRYRLNPALLPDLTAAGGRVVARDGTGTIVDAIAAEGHPFFVGHQGHPELRSRPGAPHPLLRAFVAAAAAAAARTG